MALQMDRHSPLSASSETRLTKAQPLQAGAIAPDFNLHSTPDQTVSLSDFLGRPAVLMFYPADNTPGCTKQLCAARDDYDKYVAAGVKVFGVNPGSASTHKKFSEKHGFKTPLLLDNGGKVSRAYDALMPVPIVTLVNRTVVGISRRPYR